MNKVWKISKRFLTSLTGLCLLMLVTAVIVSSLGTLLSGGMEQWQQLLKKAGPYLLIWRLIIYCIVGCFWYSTLKTYQQKGKQEGAARVKRLGMNALLIVVTVEASKIGEIL